MGKCPVISIRELQDKLGKETCHQLPSVHAIGGCDTTSGIFGLGKGGIFKKLCVSAYPEASQFDVMESGLQLMLAMYGSNVVDTLSNLGYRMFTKMAANCSYRPKPQKLPPIENAATFHIKRAHLQAIEWVSLKSCVFIHQTGDGSGMTANGNQSQWMLRRPNAGFRWVIARRLKDQRLGGFRSGAQG